MKILLFAGLLLASGVASARVCFFEHADFGGNSFCLQGHQEVYDLSQSGWNDKISSILIDQGSRVTVCVDSGFRGACRDFSFNVNNLKSYGMNDAVSSIVSDENPWDHGNQNPGGQVCFYEHAYFQGRSFCAPSRMTYDDLSRSGMNDMISSVSIPRGMSVTVCSDSRFSGRCMELRGDVLNLVDYGFNDVMSSIRVR